MQEIITTIQNDSTLMLMGGVAIAVLLAIVLVIVVSTMRVKVYKDKFKNLLYDNQEKAVHIVAIEQELQSFKIKNAKNQQELAQFNETKKILQEAKVSYETLQNKFNESEKTLSQTKATLASLEGMHETLNKAHDDLKDRLESTLEESIKYRTSNARLLMKLENGDRLAQELKQRQDEKK